MFPSPDLIAALARERQDALLREAEQQRLVRQAIGRKPRWRYRLVRVLHSVERREHVKRGAKAGQGLKEGRSALRLGAEDAELAGGIVEAAAAHVFPWWP